MTRPECLYHFTCGHAKRDIGTFNALLIPHMHPWFGRKLVWLTRNADAERVATGLTMNHQRCDRMEYRYVVDDPVVLKRCCAWLDSLERETLAPGLLADFEHDGAAAFEEWWIAYSALPARFDRGYHRAPEAVG